VPGIAMEGERDISETVGEIENIVKIFGRFLSLQRVENQNNYGDLVLFVESLTKLFILFKWPPWVKYNNNPAFKEEFDAKMKERKCSLAHFFSLGGIELILELIQKVKNEKLV
jgi:hypothetical protein